MKGGKACHPIVFRHLEGIVAPVDECEDSAVGDHDAFWIAGGTGSIENIGQVILDCSGLINWRRLLAHDAFPGNDLDSARFSRQIRRHLTCHKRGPQWRRFVQ